MNSLIIYWSGTGNTKKVADTIHHALQKFGGNQVKTFRALQVATQQYVEEHGIMSGFIDNITLNVRGIDVTVRGWVWDGWANIGTFFIP